MKIYAVVAHYDVDDRLDPSFIEVLSALEEVCDEIILVSTSFIQDSEIPTGEKVTTILRPNIGYDFYSYRVGLDEIVNRGNAHRIFIVNSSFYVINKQKFIDTLYGMLRQDEIAVTGITASHQISFHLQSYLLLIGKNILTAQWFKDFINSIEPQDSKFETILHYEVGFSRLLLANQIDLINQFRPSLFVTLYVSLSWMVKLTKIYGFNGFLKCIPFRRIQEVNWTHFGANRIGSQFGFVKSEVIRNNPFNINIDFINGHSEPKLLNNIKENLSRTSRNYVMQNDGLSKILLQKFPLSKVQSGNVALPGVKVAVVVHIFYVDLIQEIFAELGNIIEPFDLFITTPFESLIPEAINTFSARAQSVTVFLVENRGRDIGPFVLLYRTGILDCYTAVLKLHTKRSKYSGKGDFWRREIYRGLLGDSILTGKIIKMLQQQNIGMVGMEKYYLSHERYWGANKENVRGLLVAMRSLKPDKEPRLGFFAGSMFWFKPIAFEALKSISSERLIFEFENGKQDGTLAHAVERIFCNAVQNQGFVVTSSNLNGININAVNTKNNCVPVL